MQTTDYLTILNILVAFLGVLFVVFTLFEWQALRRIRKDFSTLERRLRAENHAAMKAAHRVISSYAVKDIDAPYSPVGIRCNELSLGFQCLQRPRVRLVGKG